MKFKERVFAAILICMGLVVGLVLLESGLRWLAKDVAKSDEMAPGLIRYDSRLGWRLSAEWQGGHSNIDFSTRYRTDFRGNRYQQGLSSPERTVANGLPWTAVVGDSFTFGLGVGDGQTFVQQLNRKSLSGHKYINYGVPGYSTDQELLLIQDRVLANGPERVLLVVYLANDIFDNAADFPLQADNAKPRFVLQQGELRLLTDEVPKRRKPATDRRVLRDYVSGEGSEAGWLGLRQIPAKLAELRALPEGFDDDFIARQLPNIRLFHALLSEVARQVAHQDAKLWVVVMPGQTAVASPDSKSGRFQWLLREQLLRWSMKSKVPLIDLFAPLENLKNKQASFFVHDGHLTVEGHQAVAGIIESALREGSPYRD